MPARCLLDITRCSRPAQSYRVDAPTPSAVPRILVFLSRPEGQGFRCAGTVRRRLDVRFTGNWVGIKRHALTILRKLFLLMFRSSDKLPSAPLLGPDAKSLQRCVPSVPSSFRAE